MSATYAVGSLVRARGREWVVLPEGDDDFLVLRPLGGGQDDVAGVFPALEEVAPATFPLPGIEDLGDATSAELLRTALRVGLRSSAGPFRSLARIAVEPRAYQYVPLLLALRQETVRLLVADDVGIGKTVEAGLIASELLAQGDAERLAVLCSPALAGQWQRELREKFSLDAELVLSSTVRGLERGLMMNESLFDRYPYVVVSTDFIKSPVRRHEFLNHCPDLVIVDEAHTAVADGSTTRGARHQRYELLSDLARDPARHLVLVTATPHSGKEEGFANLLALLDPALRTVDLDSPGGRRRLAEHFVQRRRADIREFLDEDTGFHQETRFPTDRQTREAPYTLSPEYRALFGKVLAFAREQVSDTQGGPVRTRVRWWSALALLRALASSPPAAAATLRTRAAAGSAMDLQEADALGRAGVLDTADDEILEQLDTTPGALLDPGPAPGPGPSDPAGPRATGPDPAAPATSHRAPAGPAPTGSGLPEAQRRRLKTLARLADALRGPGADRKLDALISEVKALLADGYDPIVFCRFLDTAEYVAQHLREALGPAVDVEAVTGTLPPAERERRIADLTASEARHVLVATDCLSEGVNLQESFQAVVHYDLAWNPTRHEQREGRVDRFGQRAATVRAVTLYGKDNPVDGMVLEVLIRRHQAISRATGVCVPVPADSDNLVQALLEGLILRGQDPDQLALDLELGRRTDDLDRQWRSAAEREKVSRTRFAQRSVHPREVAAQVAAMRDALGESGQIEHFARECLSALGSSVVPTGEGFTATTGALDVGLRDALPVAHPDPLPFHRELPVPRGHAVLNRTDPAVQALARHVVDAALDPQCAARARPAARAGVQRTRAVDRRTTLLLVRYRFHVDLPGKVEVRRLVAEDARFVAFRGSPATPQWLDDAEVEVLLRARPDANIPADQARGLAAAVLDTIDALRPDLEKTAQVRAEELLTAHRRVRAGAGAARKGLRVTAQLPVDVLGVYVYLPVPGTVAVPGAGSTGSGVEPAGSGVEPAGSGSVHSGEGSAR